MNPPAYLDSNPRFTGSSQRLLGFPLTGTREGYGYYSSQGQSGGYYGMLSTGPGPVTTLRTEWITNQFGSYYRSEQVTTPSAGWFERFMLTRYPVGSYWDETSTVSYIQTSSAAWRETNFNGMTSITPLNSSMVQGNSYAGYLLGQQKGSWNETSIPRTSYSALGTFLGQQSWQGQGQQAWLSQQQKMQSDNMRMIQQLQKTSTPKWRDPPSIKIRNR